MTRKGDSMSRLQQTEGLNDEQRELLKLVREFVNDQIIPVATELEHKDEYPQAIVDGMKEMGIFGLMIPEEYGGLGESLLTYALCVEEIARLDERLRHHQHPLHRGVHAAPARHPGAEGQVPAQDGGRGDPRVVLHERAGLRLRRGRHQVQGRQHRWR
ncbi:MAG: acyl-CoA dehydrogenase family protein [Austwickia sp.]|nr:acyl-CoA dehydrogenase family protein [Austwickia sp.]